MKLSREDARLLEAIEGGDLEAVKAALAEGADPQLMGRYGTPALHLVCKGAMDEEVRVAMARALLDAGANPDRLDSSGAPVIFEAAALGLDGFCRELLGRGAAIELRIRGSEETLLFNASRGGLLWLVDRCIEDGQSPDAPNKYGVRPIHHAAEALKARAVIERLLEAGAQVDVKDTMGLTPLVNAVARGPLEALDTLVELGLDLEVRFWGDELTPLMLAAKSGRVEVVKRLLEHGANAKAVDATGKTALDHATLSGETGEVSQRKSDEIKDLLQGA